MNPLIQEFFVASMRHLLTVLGVWLLTRGWLPFNEEDVQKYAFGFAILFVSWGWSMYNKYKSRVHFLMALQTPPGTPEEEVVAKAKTFPPSVL